MDGSWSMLFQLLARVVLLGITPISPVVPVHQVVGEVPELVRDQSSRLPKDNLSPSLLVVMALLGVI